MARVQMVCCFSFYPVFASHGKNVEISMVAPPLMLELLDVVNNVLLFLSQFPELLSELVQ